MWNPLKRNRNIGTENSGYKENSVYMLDWDDRHPYLASETKIEKIRKNGVKVTFYIDNPKINYKHHCTPDDIMKVLDILPKNDVDGIEHIYLMQPTKRKDRLCPVWGSIYFDRVKCDSKECYGCMPLLVLSALRTDADMLFPKSIHSWRKEEFEMMKTFCSKIETTKRDWVLRNINLRMVQLACTMPHEIRHWIDEKDGIIWVSNHQQREQRAHQYAKKWCSIIKESFT